MTALFGPAIFLSPLLSHQRFLNLCTFSTCCASVSSYKILILMKRLEKVPPRYRKQVETRLRRLPRLIRDRRQALDYTQEELSEGLEISIETMKAIEGGRRVPSLSMLLYICLYLGIDLRFDYR